MALNHFRSAHFRAKHFWLRDYVAEFISGLSFYIRSMASRATIRVKQNVLRVRKEP